MKNVILKYCRKYWKVDRWLLPQSFRGGRLDSGVATWDTQPKVIFFVVPTVSYITTQCPGLSAGVFCWERWRIRTLNRCHRAVGCTLNLHISSYLLLGYNLLFGYYYYYYYITITITGCHTTFTTTPTQVQLYGVYTKSKQLTIIKRKTRFVSELSKPRPIFFL